jgi:hypothetical protein
MMDTPKIRPDGRGLGPFATQKSLLILVLLLAGYTKTLTLYPCEYSNTSKIMATPCLGPCTLPAEQRGPTYTRVTIPYAVLIRDQRGDLQCQEVDP